jgi:2-dehydropantoate 2-reductase
VKIAIVGAGAMGSMYGGYLSNGGNEVYLIDIWAEHVNKINKDGLIIQKGDQEILAYPKAVTKAEDVGIVDLAVIFVKSIHTGSAVESNMALFGDDTMVLSLQNGYGNIEKIEKYAKPENVIAGTSGHGATMIGPGCIKHAGSGVSHIGLAKGKRDKRIEEVASIFEKSGFEMEINENVMELIWAKIFINVGINALTAILKIKNGQLLDYEESKVMMKDAVTEAVNVAKAAGMEFDADETIEKVYVLAEKTGENKSSMFQDVSRGRKTEIDTINGAIVSEGIKYGIETPINSMLTNMIKVIEKGN